SWRTLHKLSVQEWRDQLPSIARAMVATGKGRDALNQIESAFADPSADHTDLAELHARVARMIGADPEPLLKKLKDDFGSTTIALVRARAGFDIGPDQLAEYRKEKARDAIDITAAAGRSADEAFGFVERADDAALT